MGCQFRCPHSNLVVVKFARPLSNSPRVVSHCDVKKQSVYINLARLDPQLGMISGTNFLEDSSGDSPFLTEPLQLSILYCRRCRRGSNTGVGWESGYIGCGRGTLLGIGFTCSDSDIAAIEDVDVKRSA
ncbi:hypothetical protein TNCV_2104991 [Trichonephila clavipes]|nr:hypothetical protein TNCV_2104991 [Trichonephila clavipes]